MDEFMNLLLIENLEHVENRPLFNNRRAPEDPFQLSETEFIKLFRLSKNLTRFLIETLTPFMIEPMRPTDLNIEIKVLSALHFYAYGNYQKSVGVNKYIHLSQSSISKCLKEVTNALNRPEILNEWIQFPNNFDKLNELRRRFYQEHNMPGIIGCIDCTHVAILAPIANDPELPEYLYVNRKSYHSINVQLICDANLKVLNVNAKYPGSTHDSFIWNNSSVQRLMRTLHQRGHTDYFLIGDSGYPLRTWLMTPLDGNPPPNTPEHRYNQRLKNTRVKIERCNGLLKSRFRCLLKHRVLHYSPVFAGKIVNACVVLHNMCIDHNLPPPEPEGNDNHLEFGMFNYNVNGNNNEENLFRRVNPELAAGRIAQQRIMRNLQ